MVRREMGSEVKLALDLYNRLVGKNSVVKVEYIWKFYKHRTS